MARAGANGLGTITNLEKMAIEIPVHESSNGLVKPPQATLACFSSSCSLNKGQAVGGSASHEIAHMRRLYSALLLKASKGGRAWDRGGVICVQKHNQSET